MAEGYTVIDRRGREEPKEVCRVCGSPECHTTMYNQSGMDCVRYLRGRILELERKLVEASWSNG